MAPFIDLQGERFERLLILRRVPGPKVYWECRCDCGSIVRVAADNLRPGNTTSCGCAKLEKAGSHRRTHGCSSMPEYRAWTAAKLRCFSPTDAGYRHYGGRGITMCDEWRKDFTAFYGHIGPRPSPAHTLDRIDNDGHYEPGNVRWATRSQQANNRRPPRMPYFGTLGAKLSLLSQ